MTAQGCTIYHKFGIHDTYHATTPVRFSKSLKYLSKNSRHHSEIIIYFSEKKKKKSMTFHMNHLDRLVT